MVYRITILINPYVGQIFFLYIEQMLQNYLKKKRREDEHKLSLTEGNKTRNFHNNDGPWLAVDVRTLHTLAIPVQVRHCESCHCRG